MKLSDVLDNFRVMPLNQHTLVSFDAEDKQRIMLTWTDPDTGKEHSQYFEDQEINTDWDNEAIESMGTFTVKMTSGEVVAFIALIEFNFDDL